MTGICRFCDRDHPSGSSIGLDCIAAAAMFHGTANRTDANQHSSARLLGYRRIAMSDNATDIVGLGVVSGYGEIHSASAGLALPVQGDLTLKTSMGMGGHYTVVGLGPAATV